MYARPTSAVMVSGLRGLGTYDWGEMVNTGMDTTGKALEVISDLLDGDMAPPKQYPPQPGQPGYVPPQTGLSTGTVLLAVAVVGAIGGGIWYMRKPANVRALRGLLGLGCSCKR